MKGQMAKSKTATQTAAVSVPVITDDDLLDSSIPGSSPDAENAPPPQTPPPVAPVNGMFTAADVAEMVRSAVTAAVQGVTSVGNQSIADSIAKALTQHMGPRRLTVAELGEPKTPFNPEGKKRELLCDFFQNGAPIFERFISDGEIEMLHKLVPGSYGTPELPIAVVEKKRLNGKTRVFVVHPDDKNARLAMKNYAPNFYQMLVKLVQEAKEQRAQRRAEAKAFLNESDE